MSSAAPAASAASAASAATPVAAPPAPAPAAAWLGAPLFLYLLWYLYRSLRVAYGQGRALTAVKLLLLSFFYLVCGSTMVGLTMVYSALTL